MKVGSIVECVSPSKFPGKNVKGRNVRTGEILTVNWMGERYGRIFLGFEETHQDSCFGSELFREIQFPPSLEADISEALTREFVEI